MSETEAIDQRIASTLILSLFWASRKDSKKIIPNNKYNKFNYLTLIEDIHNIIFNNKDLNRQERWDLCCRQRFHMKSYMTQILKRIQTS